MQRLVLSVLALVCSSAALFAQGTVSGRVIDATTGQPIYGVKARIKAQKLAAFTNDDGWFRISNVKGDSATVTISGMGWNDVERRMGTAAPDERPISVTSTAKNVGDIIVYGAARRAQKLTEAPAAISTVSPMELERASAHGSLAKTMETMPGVDVVQSGSNDFNVNARGFNNSINRRTLVLIDGRDPSTPLINLNEWNSMSSILSDIASIEVVRGPGSALYGQNAYNGVVNIRTTDPRDVQGTRISLTGGEWETYRASIRHAGTFGDFAYKINLGASHQLNYSLTSRMRDSSKPNLGLEYPGLAFDVRPLTDEQRRPFLYVGTARVDYEIDPASRLVLEGGFSASGNEMYVNQTGRLLVQRVEKPFARLAYNSEHINVQGLWQRRNTPNAQLVFNAAATSLELSDVLGIDAQYNNTALDGDLRYIFGVQAEHQDVSSPLQGDAVSLISPDRVKADFYGAYGQLEYRIVPTLSAVVAARVDGSQLFSTQFSPKVGLVWEPIAKQTFRLTLNRSFLRPSYTDLYRRSPAGLPVNLARVDSLVNAAVSQAAGREVDANLNLGTAVRQFNLGNADLKPETALSLELGYKGQVNKDIFVTVDAYYNQRKNLISAPLGGLAPSVYAPVRSNTGDAGLNRIGDSVLAAELGKINPAFMSRLATYEGGPALVIAPTNIAVVDEYGVELGLNYYVTNELLLTGNYSWLDINVRENDVPSQKILPNTSKNRVNIGLEYSRPNQFDAGIMVRYVEGFRWIAGLFEGSVPSYTVVNLNAGVYVMNDLRVSVNVFNLLDNYHYEIFGGTMLRRQATATVTYSF